MLNLGVDGGTRIRSTEASNAATTLNRHAPPPPQARKWRVLLVEDDEGTAETLGWILRSLKVESSWASRGADAVAAACRGRFDLLVIDVTLPDISGMEVVRALRAHGEYVPFIIVSGAMTVSLAVDAMKLGALSVLEKPVDEPDLIAAVRSALATLDPEDERSRDAGRGGGAATALHGMAPPGMTPPGMTPHATTPHAITPHAMIPHQGTGTPAGEPGSVAERWALLVLSAIRAERDPKTISDWARCAGVSRTTLRECCRLVHISPHDARDFARMMRAIFRCGERWQPETVLDFADARTLNKLLARAGWGRTAANTPTPQEFLRLQQWIPESNPGLATLRHLMFGDSR